MILNLRPRRHGTQSHSYRL